MSKKKILLSIIGIIIIFIVGICIYGAWTMRTSYEDKVNKAFSTLEVTQDILTQEDIADLPAPVKKYLHYVGAVGKPKVHNLHMKIEGEMKQGLDKPWMKVVVDQHNFYDQYTRLFYIKGKIFGIPLTGIDSYIEGKGRMLIKLASVIKVADESGEKMDQAELVTLLNDISLLSPAALVDSRITWNSIDDQRVECSIEDKGMKVSAILYFNTEGALVDFVTEDRYYTTSDGESIKTKWSTPVKDYQTVNGVKFPAYGEGIWHLEGGDFVYAKFHMKLAEYNVTKLK
ncbi:hypothetical protein EJP82_16050 [Paenibacillus anaericanus]|uniref:Uncharacterized protein n=1 Tax=Paenibacillus anaericanus TaxID=170367 RepID=A0A3S1BQM9_9BACL|nr:DUF6544 family protein [Paenibacillus anaericanus]RUT45192.1 hypothetical protein EJP82_16050 [Paenibacillus anaericanus]